MSRYHSYLNSARDILSGYKGEEPFASFIKKYFAQHKKFGSSDRKEISNLCYCYFRMGKLDLELPTEEKILIALFLCSSSSNELLQNLKPEWNEKITLSPQEKLSILKYRVSAVFPWENELSEGIVYEHFCRSFFMQPDLFLRIRPGYEKAVLSKLKEIQVNYEFISPAIIRLPNNFKADKYFELDKEVVVQDYNSQRVAEFMSPVRPGLSDRVWDCCAGSGGKSIMAYDIDPAIDLLVTDTRESILSNLKKRFEQAGIKKYKATVIDLTNPKSKTPNSTFIIADVPCTGSGTWGRTPEQLFYFDENKINEYSAIQKKIIGNIIPSLEEGGHLLYITCSVFKKENEEVVDFIKEKFHLQQVKAELLRGYDKKADTMFAALLQKPS